MDVSIAGLIMVGIWVLALLRGLPLAVFVTLTLVPFGTAAVVNLTGVGGLSLLGLHLTAAMGMGIAIASMVIQGSRLRLTASPATIAFFLLCLYATATAFVVPRLLMNEIEVVIFKKAVTGVRVSEFFYTTLMPLQPQPTNISQTAYLWASFGFFLLIMRIAGEKGAGFIVKALLAAACVNVCLGVLDFLRLDGLLEHVRTAGYAINPDWGMHGADRLIGGYPEPSAFGSASAAFAALSASLYLDRRDLLTGGIALVSLVFAFMALSSTAFLGLGVLAAWLGFRSLRDLSMKRASRNLVLNALLFGLVAVVAAAAAIAVTPLGGFLEKVLDSLIFSKSTSASGLERAYWAERGLQAFMDTYGFGAGLGSIRSNGLLPVILGSVGLPGLLAFAALYWICLFRPLPPMDRDDPAVDTNLVYFRAGLTAAIVMISMQFVAATVLDPGVFFIALLALVYVARRNIVAASAHIEPVEGPLMGPDAKPWLLPPLKAVPDGPLRAPPE